MPERSGRPAAERGAADAAADLGDVPRIGQERVQVTDDDVEIEDHPGGAFAGRLPHRELALHHLMEADRGGAPAGPGTVRCGSGTGGTAGAGPGKSGAGGNGAAGIGPGRDRPGPDAVPGAPGPGVADPQVHGAHKAAPAEVEQVAEGNVGADQVHGDRAPEGAAAAGRDVRVVLLDPLQRQPEPAVGRRLDHQEVFGHETGRPPAPGAHRPDHPQLIGAAADHFFEVPVGAEYRVDVGVPVDPDGREPHR